MTRTRILFAKRLMTHFVGSLFLITLIGTAYANSPLIHTSSPQGYSGAPSGSLTKGHMTHHSMGHRINYDGYGSGHRSPHHGAGHSPHGMTGGHGRGHHIGHTGGHGSGHPGPHQSAEAFIDHVLKFKDGMGITDKQEADLRALETNFKKARIKLKAQGDLANLELHELLRDDNASMSAIESKLKMVHELKANLYLASIKARRDAKAVLSEEQRSRMKTIHDRIKNHSSKMKDYSKDQPAHGGRSPHGR